MMGLGASQGKMKMGPGDTTCDYDGNLKMGSSGKKRKVAKEVRLGYIYL